MQEPASPALEWSFIIPLRIAEAADGKYLSKLHSFQLWELGLELMHFCYKVVLLPAIPPSYASYSCSFQKLSFHFILFSCDRVSCILGCSQTHYIAEDDFELLLILLFLPLECWDYRHVPLNLVYLALRIKLRALYILGMCSTNQATSPALKLAFIKFTYIKNTFCFCSAYL